MPKMYEDIKASYLKKGKSLKEAKKLASMTYNARRRDNPSLPKLGNKKGGE